MKEGGGPKAEQIVLNFFVPIRGGGWGSMNLGQNPQILLFFFFERVPKSESHVVIVAMNLSWVSLKYFYDLVQIILNCNKFKCHAIVSSKDKGF